MLATNSQIMHLSQKRPIILRYQNQMKLREMRLRNYLQKQKSKPSEHSWRLWMSGRSFLRGEGKCTRVLLQEVNKVLN